MYRNSSKVLLSRAPNTRFDSPGMDVIFRRKLGAKPYPWLQLWLVVWDSSQTFDADRIFALLSRPYEHLKPQDSAHVPV
jgi:hypothetical protein